MINTDKQKNQRGGDRGGRRPVIGKIRSVKMSDELWGMCLSLPKGAGTFIRQAIQEKFDREKSR